MFLFMFLSILDLFAAMLLFISPLEIASFRLVFGFALYLFAKGYMFKGDFFSAVDMFVGGYLFLSFFFVWNFLSYVLGIYLFLKAFYSLASMGIFSKKK